jgi:protein arginine kinase activator
MMCEDCKKNTAIVHYTQIINNTKTVLNLCKSCSEKRGFSEPSGATPHSFGVQSLVSKIANEYEEENNALACPSCGETYLDFKQTGKLGCGACYATFGPRIDDLLRKIHGSTTHIGKMPGNVAPAVSQNRQIEALRTDMRRAIEREDFEKAARLRDQIRQMEQAHG